jgi:hypothetical protein
LENFGNSIASWQALGAFRGAEAAQNTGQIGTKSNQVAQSRTNNSGRRIVLVSNGRPDAARAIKGKPVKLQFSANKPPFN